MAHKVKITRKQMKQDDKFLAAIKGVTSKVVTSVEGEHWFDRFRTHFFIGGGIIVALAIAFLAYQSVSKYQERGAEKLLAQANVIYTAPVVTPEDFQKDPMLRGEGAYTDAKKKWTDAAQAFDALAKSHPSTEMGILASYYAANSHFELKDFGEAIERYQRYLDKAGKNAPFAALAKQAMGYAYEEMKKYDDAEKIFLGLVTEEGSTQAFLSLFDLARIYEKQNKIDKAIEALKKVETSQIAKTPTAGEFVKKAQAKIQMLQADKTGNAKS